MKLRRTFAYLWILGVILLLTIHYQWGEDRIETEKALWVAKRAHGLEKRARETWTPEDWSRAQETYREAIAQLPEVEDTLRIELELAAARSQMYQGDLVNAMDSLKHLLYEAETGNLDKKLRDEIRETLARSQYGLAWVMREKHVNNHIWSGVAHASRQNFRYLAETSGDAGSADAYARDLEAVVNLANSARSPRRRIDGSSPKEAVNSEDGSIPREAVNSEGEAGPIEAANAEGTEVPMEAANAEETEVPMEAANAQEGVLPREAMNAEAEMPPAEAMNAELSDAPMEALNAEASAEEMIAQLMASEEPGNQAIQGSPGSGVGKMIPDARQDFSDGASEGSAPGSGS